MPPTSEDIIKSLERLHAVMFGTPNSWVSATLIVDELQCQSISGHMVEMPLPRTHSGIKRDEFIDKMASLSLTHVITDIRYNTTFGGTTVRVEMMVYLSESPDHQTNITPEVMELFYKLPIY